ncbi:MAG: carboxypeptidase-like regulatory domain-containing protein [Flavobacteriaceae bacterium]
MKLHYTIFLFFSFLFCEAQKFHGGIVVDHEDKEPLEFVNIFNEEYGTISNADGKYAFFSSKDSVIFYRVGYDKLETTVNKLADTVFLKKSVFELSEVVVTNARSMWQKFKDSVQSNYKIAPYKERFFLRCVLRRNDSIVRMQDMVGKLKRKTLFYPEPLEPDKNDFEIELTNMRKVGIATDENNVYFIFPSFYETLLDFVRINHTGKDFELEELQLPDATKSRLNFKAIDSKKIWRNEGHYIINNLDNAILSLEGNTTSDGAPFNQNRWLRYRTLQNKKNIYFEQSSSANLYFLKSAKNFVVVETIDKDKTFKTFFTVEIIMTTFDNFGNFEVKSNINEQKDMFKLNYPYDETFWNSQNQLLLTDEMTAFIEKMGKENKEFKVRGNIID